VPSCTSQVRRSSRCNKYDGFKQKIVSVAKEVNSKVKPRKIPEVVLSDKEKGKQEQDKNATTDPVPPSTPIPLIQAIGINLCGVPATKLSPRVLLQAL